MRLDTVLAHIGEFGRYQKWLYFLVSLPSINSAVFMVMGAFLLGTPGHRYVAAQFSGYTSDFATWIQVITDSVCCWSDWQSTWLMLVEIVCTLLSSIITNQNISFMCTFLLSRTTGSKPAPTSLGLDSQPILARWLNWIETAVWHRRCGVYNCLCFFFTGY